MNASRPVSKVLILDDNPEYTDVLKRFCDEHNFVALKALNDRLGSVLRSNIDLGGVLLAQDYGGSPAEAAAVAARIDALRPELPIILRAASDLPFEALPSSLRQTVCASFDPADMATLSRAIDEYIFSLEFPNALVRGITEITEARLASLFRGMAVTWDTPSVVRDRIIFGEVFWVLVQMGVANRLKYSAQQSGDL